LSSSTPSSRLDLAHDLGRGHEIGHAGIRDELGARSQAALRGALADLPIASAELPRSAPSWREVPDVDDFASSASATLYKGFVVAETRSNCQALRMPAGCRKTAMSGSITVARTPLSFSIARQILRGDALFERAP